MGNETGLNVEYWFRLIYECFTGRCVGDLSELAALAAYIWQWIVIVGYILAVLSLIAVVYFTMKIFDLRRREEHQLGTLIVSPDSGKGNERWHHIESLMEGTHPSDWRQ